MTDSVSLPQDRAFMALALKLAHKGLYTTDPNPRVGAVIVQPGVDEHSGKVVGQGWHEIAGEPHAEVHALKEAGGAARGSTAYVTLEPCAHYGKTPPCAEALIQAGVARVVFASRDPNPLVAGKGADLLRAAGIEVSTGVLDAEARQLNPGFFSRFERGRPFIRLKTAISVDGRTAMASGESQWITGPAARADVQKLRARSSAIVTGSGTVVHDDPLLTVRPDTFCNDPRQRDLLTRKGHPACYVVEGSACVPEAAQVWRVVRKNVWVTRRTVAPGEGIEVCALPADAAGRVLIPALVDQLHQDGCNEVLVECGAGLAGAFLQAGCVDELWVYMAPILMGSAARPLANWPMERMDEKQMLKLQDMRVIGDDLRFIYTPLSPCQDARAE